MVGTPDVGRGSYPCFLGRETGSERANGLLPHSGEAGAPPRPLAPGPVALSPHSLPPGFPPAEKFSQMLIVNEELQARLAQGRSGPSRAVPGPRAPEPQLSPQSDASEVRAWLQAKGFSSG